MEYKVASTGVEWRAAPRVCRCCLSEGCYKDISSEYYWMGEKETYADMLRECFDLEITMESSSSTSSGRLICEVCITRLRDAANFKKQVISCERRFHQHLSTGASLTKPESGESSAKLTEVKIEGVKDEMVASDDDLRDAAVDDDYDDPDYDESDSLPLKYEVQKKEAMADLSFGDEMPTLSNTETTIRRVSARSKDKPASKKMKLKKKELTIKPVKAGGSKAKEPKVKKAPKAARKGPIYEFLEKSMTGEPDLERKASVDQRPAGTSLTKTHTIKPQTILFKKNAKLKPDHKIRANASTLLEYSNMVPFRLGLSSFLCAYCGDPIADPLALREHTRGKHPAPKYSTVFFNLKKDQPVKVDLTDLTCKLCSQRQLDLAAFKCHLGAAHGKALDRDVSDGLMPFVLSKDDWRCCLCTHRFLSFRSLNSHMSEHFNNYVCESCGRGFMLEQELEAHIQTHAGQTAPPSKQKKSFGHRCLKCPERFKYHDSRNRHMVEAHGFEQHLYKCLECPLEFKRRSGRHAHMQTAHNVGNNFACAQCGAMFVTQKRRDEHLAKHARDAAAPAHECAVCGKLYAQKKSLREHMKSHAPPAQLFRDHGFAPASLPPA